VTARRGVFWPLLLIALGVLFLMGNFGLISGVSWRAILSLWPLLLVLIGLDIAFARRWPLPTLAAEILVIVAGLALAATSSTVGFFGFPTGGGNGVADVSAPRGGATAMSVTVNGGAGHYRVSRGATGSDDALAEQAVIEDLRLRADLRVDQVGPEGLFRNTGQVDIDVHLASDVPTSFTMNSGAGEFDVDLSDVRVTDVRMNTGASTLRLVLPKPSGDVAVRIDAGASNLVVTVPDGVDARISTSGGLLTLRSDNVRLGEGGGTGGCVACGSSVQTSGYSSAKDRVTVTMTAGASSITVR